jgi:hypothetical protein
MPTADAFFGMKFYAGFLLRRHPNDVTLFIPHWILPLLAVAPAALPWRSSRFSLRTLLVATTLVAVVLGLIVYATR